MGKMTMALIFVVGIELALTLFMSNSTSTDHTVLYNLLIDPSNLGLSGFYQLFIARIGAIGALSAIVAGFLFLVRVEPAYAILSATLITFSLNIAQLWITINSQGVFGDAHSLVATLIVSPILVFYIMACMDYIRSPNG